MPEIATSQISVNRRFVTEAELAQQTGISKRTLQKWRLFGRGPRYVKLHGAIRYSIADFDDWVKVCPQGGGHE